MYIEGLFFATYHQHNFPALFMCFNFSFLISSKEIIMMTPKTIQSTHFFIMFCNISFLSKQTTFNSLNSYRLSFQSLYYYKLNFNCKLVKKKCMKSYTIFVSISYRQFVSENFENLVNEFCTTITYKKPLSPKIIPFFFFT